LSVADQTGRACQDIAITCRPDDPVGAVLDAISQASGTGTCGPPSVDGNVLDPRRPIGTSPLRSGRVLAFGRVPRPRPAVDEADCGSYVRVLSGPSAGQEVALRPDRPVRIGRGAGNELVLRDLDVSGVHAHVELGGSGATIADAGSRNGTWVDGERIIGKVAVTERSRIQVGGSRLTVESVASTRAVLRGGAEGELLLNRTARQRPAPYSPTTITIPQAPHDDDPRSFPIWSAALPLGMAVALVFVMHNPLYLLMGLLSPAMLAANHVTERRHRRRREQRAAGRHDVAMTQVRRRIEEAVDAEDLVLRALAPDPQTVLRIALTPRVRLWERQPGDDDWLRVRLGTADRAASVRISGELPADWLPPRLLAAPVTVDLDQRGILGLAGPQSWLDRRLGWILAQIATLHSPDELQLAVIAPGAPEHRVGWARWLPHLSAGAASSRAAWDGESAGALVNALSAGLDDDFDRLGPPPVAGRQAAPGGLLVVLVGTGDLHAWPALRDLMIRGVARGMRFLCAETDPRSLPDGCRTQLVADANGALLRADRSETVAVEVDELPDGAAEQVARALTPLRRAGESAAARIPDSVRLTDVAGRPDVERIRAAWRAGADTTAVAVGADAQGQAVLDISREGPHGLVVGTSGAGKSELLQTLVVQLATANPPDALNFFFVDYKGGSMFTDLGLPHVLGTVTNLDGRLADRAIASLHAELTRRQKQLAEWGVGDRTEYRKRAAREAGMPPFPRLVIVVDELAEMKTNLPVFVDQLVRVATIGRSLGVHLLLATQRAAGAVDGQIRSNIALRICLRVTDDSDSIDVIDRPDAARIPPHLPGRALVLGGSGVRPLQTARASAPQRGAAAHGARAIPLFWQSDVPPEPAEQTTTDGSTELNAAVEAVCAAANLDRRTPPYPVWAPPLDAVVLLDRVGSQPSALTVGLRDRPALQVQEPLHLPLGTGHLAIVGSPQTGRTTALVAIAAALASANPPDRVHLHAVDGSGGLGRLTRLPHVGVVAADEESERVDRLLARLVDVVRERRRGLAAEGATSIDELTDADRPPHVVLLVDCWDGVYDLQDSTAQTAMTDILTSGLAAGVTVVMTGDERLLRPRLLNRFGYRLCLRLNNPSDVAQAGLDHRRKPEGLAPGRGLWVEDGSEVQVPVLTAGRTADARRAAIDELGSALRSRFGMPHGDRAPLRLDPLPVRIRLADAVAAGPVPQGTHTLLGVAGDALAPLWVPLRRGRGRVVVAGPPRSGRSTAAAALATAAVAAGSRVVLLGDADHPAVAAAAAAGVVLVEPDGLADALQAASPDVLVIDDVDRTVVPDQTAAVLSALDGPALILAGEIDAFGFGARGLLKAARGAENVVLLSPPNHLAASSVGVTISRDAAFSGPPGRAVLAVRGHNALGQVPDPA
jgi:S-DNA-T family DNA segregation ATPase FtsK/SpoIIIE